MVLLELLASKATVLLLPCSLKRPGNGLCNALDPFISGTIPLCSTLVELFCLASNFASQGKGFSTLHGSAEHPDLDLALVFHVVSLQSPRPLPESISSVETTQPLGVAGVKPQITHNDVHMLNSY